MKQTTPGAFLLALDGMQSELTRTFALWSLRAGMDIYSLQRLMGHSDLTMLRRYLALVESDLQNAHRKHGPVDSNL